MRGEYDIARTLDKRSKTIFDEPDAGAHNPVCIACIIRLG